LLKTRYQLVGLRSSPPRISISSFTNNPINRLLQSIQSSAMFMARRVHQGSAVAGPTKRRNANKYSGMHQNTVLLVTNMLTNTPRIGFGKKVNNRRSFRCCQKMDDSPALSLAHRNVSGKRRSLTPWIRTQRLFVV
jgi:hypothetical protein